MSRFKRLKEFEFDILPDTSFDVWVEGVCIGTVAAVDSESRNDRWAFLPFTKGGKWTAYHGAKKIKMRCKRDAVAALVLNHFAGSIELDSGEDSVEEL